MKLKTVFALVILLFSNTFSYCLYVQPPLKSLVEESDLIAIVQIQKGLSEDEIFSKYNLYSEFDYCAVGEIIEILKGKPSGKFITINFKWRAQKPNISCLDQGKKYVLCLKGKETSFLLYFPHGGASVYGSWDVNDKYNGRDINELKIEIEKYNRNKDNKEK